MGSVLVLATATRAPHGEAVEVRDFAMASMLLGIGTTHLLHARHFWWSMASRGVTVVAVLVAVARWGPTVFWSVTALYVVGAVLAVVARHAQRRQSILRRYADVFD
jgi:hypothetical protein